MMNKSELMKAKVLLALHYNHKWMTGNEIISWASAANLMEKKHVKSRRGNSHPVYRILSAMSNEDNHNIYTPIMKRRVREFGPEAGCYEYAITGVTNTIRRFMFAIKTI